MFLLTALEYQRDESTEKNDKASALMSNKFKIRGQHVQVKENQVSTSKDGITASVEAELVGAPSNQLVQQKETTGKWLYIFKFLGNEQF